MQSFKIEFLEKYNFLASSAEKGQEHFPDEICDYVVNEFELQSMVLFKVTDDNNLMVLGKSASAKKSYIRGASFGCSVCKLLIEKDPALTFHSDAECELQISEFVIYESCMTIKITDRNRAFIKFARKTPFIRTEIDHFKSVADFLASLLRIWTAARGGEILVSDKSTSEIVNSISQELRTPANSIIGFSSLLNEDTLSSTQSEYVSIIKNNAHNLLLLINDMIDLAKIDSSKVKENRTPIEIQFFIDEIIKLFRDKIDSSKIEIIADIDK
ncbi:MAG: sensor histidine kinase, partial [Syntrophothermus sp.]